VLGKIAIETGDSMIAEGYMRSAIQQFRLAHSITTSTPNRLAHETLSNLGVAYFERAKLLVGNPKASVQLRLKLLIRAENCVREALFSLRNLRKYIDNYMLILMHIGLTKKEIGDEDWESFFKQSETFIGEGDSLLNASALYIHWGRLLMMNIDSKPLALEKLDKAIAFAKKCTQNELQPMLSTLNWANSLMLKAKLLGDPAATEILEAYQLFDRASKQWPAAFDVWADWSCSLFEHLEILHLVGKERADEAYKLLIEAEEKISKCLEISPTWVKGKHMEERVLDNMLTFETDENKREKIHLQIIDRTRIEGDQLGYYSRLAKSYYGLACLKKNQEKMHEYMALAYDNFEKMVILRTNIQAENLLELLRSEEMPVGDLVSVSIL
jgi:tetratricopeptide (TPR) repeat protein